MGFSLLKLSDLSLIRKKKLFFLEPLASAEETAQSEGGGGKEKIAGVSRTPEVRSPLRKRKKKKGEVLQRSRGELTD